MVDYIDLHKDEFGIEPICEVLLIAPSTYYAAKRTRGGSSSLLERLAARGALNDQLGREQVACDRSEGDARGAGEQAGGDGADHGKQYANGLGLLRAFVPELRAVASGAAAVRPGGLREPPHADRPQQAVEGVWLDCSIVIIQSCRCRQP